MTAHTYGGFTVLPRWEDQATSAMTRYPIQSLYPDIVLTRDYHILLIPGARLVATSINLIRHWFRSDSKGEAPFNAFVLVLSYALVNWFSTE